MKLKATKSKSPLKAQTQKTGYFCSELIAAAYKDIGLLDPLISASQYLPGIFFLQCEILKTSKKRKFFNGKKFETCARSNTF